MKPQIVKPYSFSKVGINEVTGLKPVLLTLMKPVLELIQDKVYWSKLELGESEYTSRDGFIPHSHNCGGIELSLVAPNCERDSFDFLSFGECDECTALDEGQCGYEGQECGYENEGHLDAKFRVWLKFEGFDEETGEMSFYLYAGGGNGDAPYFRTKYEATIFEAEFKAKTLAELKRIGAAHIKALLKKLG